MSDLNRLTDIQDGRTMSRGYAFQMITKDLQASIDCADNEADHKNMTEALEILEEHLYKTFYRSDLPPGIARLIE